MRVSVPTIPQAILSKAVQAQAIPRAAAIERVAQFLTPGNVAVLTGAGVSVDSGIRAYRGKDGRYMNPDYKPILYHELISETENGQAFRQRYWLRSYLGYPSVRDALPNPTHYALAALQHSNKVSKLITQNVDGLHSKAVTDSWTLSRIRENILELHGTLHSVRCKYGHTVDRTSFQDWLSAANPQWKEIAEGYEQSGDKPRANPDGDVALDGVSYETFNVPDCAACLLENRRNNVLKPEVIFFGESISKEVKDRSFLDVEQADRLLMIGTTLATHSAFRLLKHALELKKPAMLLNIGPSRADDIPGVEKIEISAGALRDMAQVVLGSQASDPVTQKLLGSGVALPPPEDDRTAPWATG